MPEPICVAALYKFARFSEPASIRPTLLALCVANDIKGTLLLAPEGINGTIAGTPRAIETVIAHIRTLPDCTALEVKYSAAETPPFHRMKVRLKQEIVTMGEPDIDPLEGTGMYVKPADWNALIADPDTVVIDTRNDYEVRIGTFEGATNPETRSFSEFPAWFRANRDTLTGRKIAMFCTGGIRCEKSTAFLKAEGIENTFHLQGGILNYLEQVPPDESRWQGECFVFDERVAVGHGLASGTHTLCRACRMPVGPVDRASPRYVEGVGCPACHASRDNVRRAGYAERHRQVRLAEARGATHIGVRATARREETER